MNQDLTQAKSPVQQRPLRTGWIVLASAGTALVAASGFSILACSMGILFEGIPLLFVMVQSVLVCMAVTWVTALVLKRTRNHFGWRILLTEVSAAALVAVAVLSILDTRQRLKRLTHPAPLPSGLRILQGNEGLFCYEVHFVGPAESITTVLQSRGLVEVPSVLPPPKEVQVPSEPPQHLDLELQGWKWREQTEVSRGWWKPTAMSNPKFFFREHSAGETNAGWIEGWWVNGSTDEVYVTQRM